MLALKSDLAGKADAVNVRVFANGLYDFFNVLPADPVVIIDEDDEAPPGLVDQLVPLGSNSSLAAIPKKQYFNFVAAI